MQGVLRTVAPLVLPESPADDEVDVLSSPLSRLHSPAGALSPWARQGVYEAVRGCLFSGHPALAGMMFENV